MALFKISKGLKNNLDKQTMVEGYCWYTTDDSLFYIDSTDNDGNLQRKALNAAQLNPSINAGSGNKPIYIKEGVPIECGSSLNVDITGNASTSTIAEQAKLAYTLGESNGTKYSFGSESLPIYFKNGIPIVCNKNNLFSELSYTPGTNNGTIKTVIAGLERSDTIDAATVDQAGLVITGEQTFTGKKTFNQGIVGSLEGNATSATTASQTKASLTIGNKTFNGSIAITINASDLNAKTVQTAVSDPAASGNSYSYIDTISQNTNGVISVTKKSIPDASNTVKGLVTTAEQSFKGKKTFVDGIVADVTGNLDGNAATATTATDATNIYSSASTAKAYVLGTTTASSANHATVYNASVYTSGSVLYGACWNDYAEFRISECQEPGRVICENGDDTLSLAIERLQPAGNVISDTFGYAIGETEMAKTPIAVAGRVLVYPYEDRYSYNPGDAVCAAPGGTVSKMTREEIITYPERIIGTVSAIPEYETWGEGNISVNGRIWIKVK